MTREIKYFSGSTNFRTSTIKASTFETLQTPDVVHDTTEMSASSAAKYIVSDSAGKVLALPTGSSRNYLYSDDYGYTFTPMQLPAAMTVGAAAYAGDQWLVLPTSGTVAYTSPDGITWTQRTLATSLNYASVAYQNGIYVALAQNSSTYNTSPDGITWTQRTLPQTTATSQRYILAAGGGFFVYAPSSSNTAYHSTDGITWNARTVTGANTMSAVGFVNGYFVIFGSSNVFGYTTNPASWSTGSLQTTFSAMAIASGGGHLIAFGNSGQAYYTDTGTSMTLVHNGNEIAFGATNVYACYDGQKSILRTDTGSVGALYRMVQSKYGGYQTRSLPATANWYSMIYGASLNTWVAVAGTGTQAASSTDGGTSWTSRTLSSSQAWRELAFGAGTFVAINQNNNTGSYSTNGTTWTGMTLTGVTSPTGVVYGDKFVAVGSNSASSSTDGITWTSRTLGISATAVTYGNGLYVAVGNSTASTSPDGITWTTRTFPLSAASSVAYGNGMYIATSANNNSYTVSYDGMNWSPVVSFPGSWNAKAAGVAFVNDRFIIGGDSTNTYMVTTDGTSFQLHKNGLSTTLDGRWAGDGTTFLMLSVGLSTATMYQWDGRGTMTADVDYILHESRFSSASYEAIQFLNGEYVLGSAITSDGGYSWGVSDYNGAYSGEARKTAYGNGAYVMVNNSNQLCYSTNARDWVRTTTLSNMSAPGTVLWDGSKFIVLAQSGTVAATSTNGKTWTAITQVSGNWTTMAHNGSNLYVAFQGASAGATYMTSTDGTTWTSRTFPTSNYYHRSVVHVDGSFFVMSAVSPTSTSGMVFKSDDGISWTAVELPSAGVWISMYSANDALWMTTTRGLVVVTYDKGVTWKIVADLGLNNSTTSITTLAVSDNGGEALLIGSSGYIARLRLGQTAIYTVPAGRSSKVTFNYLKNTQANLNFMMDNVPVWEVTTINSEADATVLDKSIYMGPGSQILANVDMDYSFLAIEEY